MSASTVPEPSLLTAGWPDEVVGADVRVPVLGGGLRRYVNLDNAASTPPLVSVQQAVDRFAPWYSSVHRGAGFKSLLSTHAYEACRASVAAFVGADPARHAVIFVKNTTEGLNKLSHTLAAANPLVITTIMEHHANMLPWRVSQHETRYIAVDRAGVLQLDDLERHLRDAPTTRPRLVAISGAYNTTGYAPPLRRIGQLAHAWGAQLLVDGAQLVPHRQVDMGADGIDFLVFSGHKLYAPYGAGVVVAPRSAFLGTPDLVGGGIVDLVTMNRVVWAALPEREEAGSPNVIGVVALDAALHTLSRLGMRQLEQHEAALTAYAHDRLLTVPGLQLLGPSRASDRVGLFSFVLPDLNGFLLATVLGCEWGIGVRAGCFCAHPGMLHVLGITPERQLEVEQAILAHQTSGAVRASFGLYTTRADVDALVEALHAIVRDGPRGSYRRDPATGDYLPTDWSPPLHDYFTIGS